GGEPSQERLDVVEERRVAGQLGGARRDLDCSGLALVSNRNIRLSVGAWAAFAVRSDRDDGLVLAGELALRGDVHRPAVFPGSANENAMARGGAGPVDRGGVG